MLEILAGLSGLAAVPSLSHRHARVEQLAHVALTAAFLAANPAGATLTLIFLALNAACHIGAATSSWRSRFAAAVFLALYANEKWFLVAVAAVYATVVVTVTAVDNKENFAWVFTERKGR